MGVNQWTAPKRPLLAGAAPDEAYTVMGREVLVVFTFSGLGDFKEAELRICAHLILSPRDFFRARARARTS